MYVGLLKTIKKLREVNIYTTVSNLKSYEKDNKNFRSPGSFKCMKE